MPKLPSEPLPPEAAALQNRIAAKEQTSLIEAPLRAVPAAVSADADVAECFDAWEAVIAAEALTQL